MTNLSAVTFDPAGDELNKMNVVSVHIDPNDVGVYTINWDKPFSTNHYHLVGTSLNGHILTFRQKEVDSVEAVIETTEALRVYQGASVMAFE